MPRKQSTNVSLSAETYNRLRYYCQERGISIAGFVGSQIEAALDELAAPYVVSAPRPDISPVPPRRAPGPPKWRESRTFHAADLRARRPGELLHRIAQRDEAGRVGVDREQAIRRMATKPWASTARYLGVSRGYHVFAYRETP